jgi:four helix bundle protein
MNNGYRNLLVWQKSIDLAEAIYKLTRALPDDEKYGLTSQMRRAAVSIASNIAEGSKRSSDKDYRNFIVIAMGSAAELITQLLVSYRLKYIPKADFEKSTADLEEIERMLNGLRQRLDSGKKKT